jgi:protein SCO1/2
MFYQRLSLSLLLTCVLGATAAAQQPAAGGDFTLTDHNGEKFRLADQRGKVILLFFGYTSCAEACPVILGRINSVFKQLGPDREKALAVFISVDPQRDTTQVLREYVKYFSAHTVALTGKKEELDAVVKRYGAKYEIEKSDSALGYHVSHTTDIYLIDQRGALRSRFKHTDRAALMVERIKRLFNTTDRIQPRVGDLRRAREWQLLIGPNHLKTAAVVNDDERLPAADRSASDAFRLHLLGESYVKPSHGATLGATPLVERERRFRVTD